MDPQAIHPRIQLFFNSMISVLEKNGLQDSELISHILHLLWNDTLLFEEQEKIMKYKQDSRAVKYIHELGEKYKLTDIARKPDDLGYILYSVTGLNTKTYKKYFKEYYDIIYDWFEWEYYNVFSDDDLKNTILENQKNFLFGGLDQEIMMKIISKADDLNKIQPFMRAYQSLENHCFYTYDTQVFSKFSHDVIESLSLYSRIKPDEIDNFIVTAQKGYTHISTFFSWEQKENERLYNEKCKFLDTLEFSESNRERTKKDFLKVYTNNYHTEYSSILRHTYDWVLRVAPDILCKKDAVTIFATIVFLTHELHSGCGSQFIPRGFQYIHEDSLKKYILQERKAANIRAIESYASQALDDLLYMIPDEIEPLFFFPVMKTQKQEEKLIEAWEKLKETTRKHY